MHIKAPKHRHWLVLPIAAVMLLSTTFQMTFTMNASVLTSDVLHENTSDAPRVVSLSKDTRALLFHGAELVQSSDEIVLVNGSVLFHTRSIETLRLETIELFALGGLFHVTVRGDAITVAALSAPVVVREGTALMLIPAGMQWRLEGSLTGENVASQNWLKKRHLRSIPHRFKKEQLQNEDALLFDEDSFHIDTVTDVFGDAFGILRLPKSQEQYESDQQINSLRELEGMIDDGDTESVTEFLLENNVRDIFSSKEAKKILSRTLVRSDDPLMRSLLLPLLISDETLWLLSGVHEKLRARTWGLPKPDLSEEALYVSLSTLMLSDVLQEALPLTVQDVWMEDLIVGIDSLSNQEAFVEHVVGTLTDHYERMFESGYPLRAKKTLETLSLLSDRYGIDLDVLQIEHIDPLNLTVLEENEEEEVLVEEELSEEHITPDEIKNQAYNLLRDAKALFTVETSIIPRAPSFAEIENIVFPSGEGDRMMRFTLDVSSLEVHGIQIEDVAYPFTLSWESFLAWAKG